MNYLFCNHVGVLVQFDVLDDENSKLSEDGRDALGMLEVGIPVLAPADMLDKEEIWHQEFVSEFVQKHWKELSVERDSNILIQDFLEIVDNETLQAGCSCRTSFEMQLTYDDISCFLNNRELPAKYKQKLVQHGYDASKPLLVLAPKAEFLSGMPQADKKRKMATQ